MAADHLACINHYRFREDCRQCRDKKAQIERIVQLGGRNLLWLLEPPEVLHMPSESEVK